MEQPADLVILASYTFNNTRLMLLSGIGKPYDPVRNEGVVGRNYSYQTGGKVALFFEDREFNPFIGCGMVGTSIDEFNGDNFDHAGLGFVGGSAFPQNPANSPTETIGALACWAADSIKDLYLKRPAALV